MAASIHKRKYDETNKEKVEEVEMDTRHSSDEESDESEESVYSGLEEEEETDSDEEESDEEESDDEGGASSADDDDDNKAVKLQIDDENEVESEPDTGTLTDRQTKSTKDTIQVPTDEYENDSSDEEDLRNTIGNVPIEWYRQFDHVGYDILGKKIMKPESGDKLDEFLNRMDNPDYWRTVRDKSTGQNVVLTDEDAELVKNYRAGRYASSTAQTNNYEPWIDFFTNEVMIHPLKNTPASKRSFIPSLWEKKKVSQYVHAIKMGWMKPKKTQTDDEEEDKFYELWTTDSQSEISRRIKHNIPAPRMALPGHAESYNPPPEYLFTEEEELAWQHQDPEDRRSDFIPSKFSSLRLVPSYRNFVKERFERCLDLYLCPRKRKMRLNVHAEDLIPKVPKPRDLQPFPTTQSIVYRGHTGMVRTISVCPGGQWLASGSDDSTLRLWEVATGRCVRSVDMGAVVRVVTWSPNKDVSLLAVSAGCDVVLMNPLVGDKLVISNTDKSISSFQPPDQTAQPHRKAPVEWTQCSGAAWDQGFRIKISHSKDVSSVAWHGAGDYLVSVWPGPLSQSVVVHQVTKRRSQLPFTKNKGLVQCVRFHPTRPFLFVATQIYVRVYNLLKQELVKKLMTNCKWVSSLAIHPAGDNLIIGSYDCRLSWFDMDLSTKPYQTLRHQKRAIRQVCFHPRYPLFASCSDDGSVVVCHATVYNDLLQNPLIVPVKILRGHKVTEDLGVLDCTFHPTQPWIFSSGADHNISLFT